MKKILFVVNISLKNPVRGTPIRICNFIRQIKKEHNIIVCAKDFDNEENVIFIKYPELKGIKKLSFLKTIVRKNGINMVITATETGIKLPVFLKILTRVKIVIDIHGLYYDELLFARKIGRINQFFNQLIVSVWLRCYDLIFVVSGKLQDHYLGINKNIKVIHGGVDIGLFEKAKYIPQNVFTIGYMGNVRKYQGTEYLLESVKNIKQKNKDFKFQLNFIMSGDIEGINSVIKKYKLEKETKLRHNMKHEQVFPLIAKSDVLVIPRPSIKMTEYAYPSKIPEFMLTGLPIILTNVGPISEFKIDKDIFIFVSVKNIVSNLEKAIMKVYNMPINERAQIGRNAREYVRSNLSWDNLGKTINIYLEKL